MNVPCRIRLDCEGSDFPITNYSSEGGEPNAPRVGPVFPNPNPKPGDDGGGFSAGGCLAVCYSYVSQQEADNCALMQEQLCAKGGRGSGGPDPGDTLFYSAETGCSSACPDGSVFTYTVPAGLFIGSTQAEADALAHAYACQQAQLQRVCINGSVPRACVGEPYSTTLTATTISNTTWSISGSLPAGITATPVGNNGITLSGTPTVCGVYAFSLTARDAFGNHMTRAISLTVWGIASAQLPDGAMNTAYDFTLTADNAVAPVTFTQGTGAFPAGIDIDGSGKISGTPTQSGDFTVVVNVHDKTGSCNRELHLTIAGCPRPTTRIWTAPSTIGTGLDHLGVSQIGPINTTQTFAARGDDPIATPLDIISFTGTPSVLRSFAFPGNPRTLCHGVIYEPSSGLIVVYASKPDLGKCYVAFFHPVTGFISEIEVAVATNGVRSSLDRLIAGKVVMVTANETFGVSDWMHIIDVPTKSIDRTIELNNPNATVLPPVGQRGFAGEYFCSADRLARPVAYRNGALQVSAMSIVNLTTGNEDYRYDLSAGFHCVYNDKTQKFFGTSTEDSNTTLRFIDPLTGVESSRVTLPLDGNGDPMRANGHSYPCYNYGLDCIVIEVFDVAAFHYNLLFLNSATGALMQTIDLTALDRGLYSITCDDSDGSVYLQSYNYWDFYRIKPTITS